MAVAVWFSQNNKNRLSEIISISDSLSIFANDFTGQSSKVSFQSQDSKQVDQTLPELSHLLEPKG
jgi:hypothetical protein